MILLRIWKGHKIGIALWALQWLFQLANRKYEYSSPDPGDFELVHAGSEKIA